MSTVEPPADAAMAPDAGAISPRTYDDLVQDLAQALDVRPRKAESWINQHGAVAAEERIQAHWTDRGFYRSAPFPKDGARKGGDSR